MNRPLACMSVLAAALVAVGCSERTEGPPTGPEFHTILNTASGCDLQHISQLANSYFSPPRQQDVKPLVDALTAATLYSSAAKNSGFDIMAQMEAALGDGTAGVPSVGSNLINHLLLCMYNPTSEAASYPASFPDTFNVALTPSLTGAFGHRSSGTDPVYSRSSAFTLGFTGIAPVGSWGVVPPLDNPARVVFYGRPATNSTGVIPLTYDWRTIPHNATFNPNIIVAICIDVTPPANPTLMLNEQGVAILSFADAGFLPSADCSPTNTALLDHSSPFQLARRLVGFGTALLSPRPLMAAALSPGGLGGTSSKCCSKVGPQNVPSAQLTFVPDPPASNVQIAQYFPVQVQATVGTTGVNGDCISLAAINNKGQKTDLLGAHTCGAGSGPTSVTSTVNNVAGVAQFCVNDPKTGTITLVATGDIEGRNDTPVTKNSQKLNVKPSVNIAPCTP